MGKNKMAFIVYVLPVLVFITLVVYIPFIMSMCYSFTEWNGISREAKFIGLENFKIIFTEDGSFKDSALFTLKFSVLFIVITNILAMITAVMLNKEIKTSNMLRAGFFVPYILSLVIVGFIWKFIFIQGFDTLEKMTNLNFFSWSWLGDAKLAFWSVLFVSIWQSVGFYIVIYIAGLQSISFELIEAAIVDGARSTTRFFKVVIPLIMPSVTACVFLSLTNSIKVFDVIVSLTNGGPGGATTSITYDIYKEAFQNNSYGYGTAKALLLFLAILVITLIQVKFFKSKEVEM
jgi:raffinose/stachyose/melibiose transport system permease protein